MGGSIRGSRSPGARRAGIACSALVLAALAAPAAASGELIYVAPEDESSGFFCSESQPCGITVGINLAAGDDDEVLLAPGTYETTAELEVPSGAMNVTIRPRDPATRPVIDSTAGTVLQLTGPNATVRGFDIVHDSGPSPALFALSSSSRIRNMFSISNGDTPCQIGGGRITDSICISTSTNGRALRTSVGGAGTLSPIVRNVTLIATGINGTGIYASGSGAGGVVSMDVASSIVAGEGVDVETQAASGASVDVALAASNFESRAIDPGTTITDPATAGNQTEEPIFVGFGLEQSPDSPTVDAGIVDAETGTTDVYGDNRPQGFGNDIGADELPDTVAPQTTITKKPKRRTKSRRAKFAFESNEPTSDFVCKLDKGIFGGGEYESCGASVTLRSLSRGRHSISVRAVDSAGNIDPTPAKYRWKVRKRKR